MVAAEPEISIFILQTAINTLAGKCTGFIGVVNNFTGCNIQFTQPRITAQPVIAVLILGDRVNVIIVAHTLLLSIKTDLSILQDPNAFQRTKNNAVIRAVVIQ